MATTITMPQLGETVTEGTVAQWLKKVGDNVEKYEPFVEVSTDKVNAEVPSPVTGVIREMLVKEGETVATGTAIAVIDEVGAAASAPAASNAPAAPSTHATAPSAPAAASFSPSEQVANGAVASNGHAKIPQTIPAPPTGGGTPEDALRGCSPAVRRLAREHRIDIRTISGSGSNGRVTADDVLAAARSGAPAAQAAPATHASDAPAAHQTSATPAAPAPPSGTSTYAQPIPGTIVPLNQSRRIIAERMVESKHTAPHAWSMVEVDVTNVWKWRSREKDRFERETGYKLTLMPFFIRAVVESLAKFPLMNAKFTPDGIYVQKDVNIGIAIGLATNLVVPVVKHADQLSIKGLAIAGGELIERARKGKLGVDDLAGGTFTVNNNGANGSYASAPIINAGQAGIVTMESVVRKPVVRDDDAIAIRSMMNCCLSLDHRVVDGYVASGFLADLKKRLEAMGPEGAL
jgi:2-oxoisovalerate dehydrogenase E2 component (dihydrolipoyl transacylase)